MSPSRFMIAATLILASFTMAIAGPEKVTDYATIADAFFAEVAAGHPDTAIDQIFATNPWFQKNPDQIQSVKTSFVGMKGLVGEYIDNALVLEKELASRYAYQYYFVAYERQPLKVEFEFYRPGDTWMLLNFAFNADLVSDLKEAAKYSLGDALE